MRRWLIVLGCIGLLLSGCVTQTKSIFTVKENRDQAVEDYVQLGTLYYKQHHYDLARSRLKRALKLNPDSVGAHAALGLVYDAQHEPKLAEKNFKQALDEDPKYTRGRTYYGAFLYSHGRYKEAYQQFEKASQDPDYSDRTLIFVNLAQSAERIKKNPKALDAFERALQFSPGNFQALSGITSLLVQMNRYDQARQYYQRLLTKINHSKSVKHSPQTLWTGILIARHFGNSDQESSLALLLRDHYPNSPEFKQYKALTSNE